MNTVHKYDFKLGISKYSHHIKHLNKYTRMNFQYLQCLDLWNPKYIDYYENKEIGDYDILDSDNDGTSIEEKPFTIDVGISIIPAFKKVIIKIIN